MIATYPANETKKLAVREVPNGPVIRKLEPGDVEAVEIIEKGWCKLHDGFCRADLVVVTDDMMAEQGEPDTASDEAPTVPPADDDSAELEKMTKDQLKELAEQSGIQLEDGMKKAEIIAAILNG